MSIGLKLTDAKILFGDEIVLDRLNLSVPAGESTAIIGPWQRSRVNQCSLNIF